MSQLQPEPRESSFAQLADAFRAGDASAFSSLADAFPWGEADAAQWLAAADMAVSLGLLPLARDLAQQGQARWPGEGGFLRIWAIVRPPQVTVQPRDPAADSLQRSQQRLG